MRSRGRNRFILIDTLAAQLFGAQTGRAYVAARPDRFFLPLLPFPPVSTALFSFSPSDVSILGCQKGGAMLVVLRTAAHPYAP